MSSMDPMESFRAQQSGTHRYGLKRWLIALYWILALAFAAVGCLPVLLRLSPGNSPSPALSVFFVLFGVIAIYILLRTMRQYVELTSKSLTVGGLRGARTLQLDTLKGRRSVSSRYGNYLVFECINAGVPKLSIATNFAFDDYWRNWLQTVPDLDELDRKVLLDAISSDTSLGTTPEERLQKLASAKSIAVALSVLAIALTAALWFGGHALNPTLFGLLDVILVLLPWITVFLIARNPLLYTPLASKRDPRATLMFVLFAAGIGLLASPFPDMHSVAPATVLAYACIPGILLVIALYTAMAKPRLPRLLVILLVIGVLYGDGLVLQINTQLDKSPIGQYASPVLEKSISSGRNTTYHLDLGPSDQMLEGQRISVSSRLYNAVNVGDSVCFTSHDGALQVGWYSVDSCSSSPGPR